MNFRLLLLVFLKVLILFSCDSVIRKQGQVFDKHTNKSLENVCISISNLDTVYTDNSGDFIVDKVLHGTTKPNTYLLFSKIKYKPSLLKVSNEKMKILVFLEPINHEFEPKINPELIPLIYWIDLLLISFINAVTIVFIVVNKKIRKRILWLIGVFLLNFSFEFSYIDGTLMSIKLINIPPFLEHYWRHPFSFQITIPIVGILFWLLYGIPSCNKFLTNLNYSSGKRDKSLK